VGRQIPEKDFDAVYIFEMFDT
jgi:hypothetical protein